MAYLFTKDLETGNALIDAEHKKLIEAINLLLEACSKGKGRDEISSTMFFLKSYTEKHFADEERLQRESRYPGFTEHKGYHEYFRKKIVELEARLKQEGPSIVLVGELNHALADWFLNHIKTQDKKVAAHIQQSSQK